MQGLRVTKSPSQNAKLVGDRRGIPFYATYREVGATCPSDCPLLGNGCYAEHGHVAMQQRGRHSNDDGAIFLRELDRLPEGAIVRLHVSGDVMLSDEVDERYLDALIEGAKRRPDVTMFGYTHAWRRIDRQRFDFPANLALNASCDTPADVDEAAARGWPTTTVVPSDTAWKRQGATVVCPQQTVGLSCYDCRLCMNAERPLAVAFKAHGTRTKKVDERLKLPTAA